MQTMRNAAGIRAIRFRDSIGWTVSLRAGHRHHAEPATPLASASSASAKPARPSPAGCATPASRPSPPGTSCFRRPRARSSSRPARRWARGLRRSAADAVRGSDIIVSAVTAASSLEAATVGRAASDRQSLFPRHQLGVARPQEGDREAARRARRAMSTSRSSRRSIRRGTRRRCCSPARTPRPSCRS